MEDLRKHFMIFNCINIIIPLLGSGALGIAIGESNDIKSGDKDLALPPSDMNQMQKGEPPGRIRL